MKQTFPIALIIDYFSFYANAQKTVPYNIAELLNSNMLATHTFNQARMLHVGFGENT